MPCTHCSCEFQQKMSEQIRAYRKAHPEPDASWADLLLRQAQNDGDSPCCAQLLLLYCGYCLGTPTNLRDLAHEVAALLREP